MAKVSIQNIAALLIEKHGLSQEEAEKFIITLFDVLNDGLHYEKAVKIKGLGTFKVIDVRERASVNVNTGERVVIEGHGKITFTPDPIMRDLVNKPFAQFETVVINEGVQFDELDNVADSDTSDDVMDDIPVYEPAEEKSFVGNVATEDIDIADEYAEETVSKSELTTSEETEPDDTKVIAADVKEPVAGPAENDAAEESNGIAETVDMPEEPQQDNPQVVETKEDIVEDENIEDASDSEDEDEEGVYDEEEKDFFSRYKYWLFALIVWIVGAAGFGAGYYYGRYCGPNSGTLVTDSAAIEPLEVKIVKDSLVADSLLPVIDTLQTKNADDTLKVEKKEESAKSKVSAQLPTGLTEKEQAIFNTAGVMVRKGAYIIEGTDFTVKIKSGETIKRIVKRYLGEGMECYIQVHNGIVEVKEGMNLNIPKLRIKKIKK